MRDTLTSTLIAAWGRAAASSAEAAVAGCHSDDYRRGSVGKVASSPRLVDAGAETSHAYLIMATAASVHVGASTESTGDEANQVTQMNRGA